MTASLRVSVLGPVRAWRGDTELRLGPARQRAVLAVLAAHANQVVSRADLISAVWGASAPETAAGSVYTYVSGLRRVLEPDRGTPSVLVSDRSGYRLVLDPAALDSAEFRRQCALAAGHARAGDLDAAVTGWDTALAGWHGEPYAHLTSPALAADRARLSGLRLTAVQQRAGARLDRGDDGPVAELTALVREHPLHEPAYELLMRALHRAGRVTDALEVFHRARVVLADRGLKPGKDLQRRYERILTESADDDVPAEHGGVMWVDGPDPTLTARVRHSRLIRVDGTDPVAALARELDVTVTGLGRLAAVTALTARLRALAATEPVVLVAGDIRPGATELLLWDRLAALTERMPLLLVLATAHGDDPGLAPLRRAVQSRLTPAGPPLADRRRDAVRGHHPDLSGVRAAPGDDRSGAPAAAGTRRHPALATP